MRRSRNEKNRKKFKNNFDDYHLEWMEKPDIANNLGELSGKQIRNISSMLKRKIDYIYDNFKVEEKYIYHANLFYMYETLERYFGIHTFLYKKSLKNSSPEEIKKRIEEDLINSPENVFGYEVAFSKKMTTKITDALHWFSVFFQKYTKLYVMPLKNQDKTGKKLCDIFMDRINSKKPVFEFKGSKELEKEAEFINDILNQIQYARENLNLLFCGFPETDKKVTKIAKSALTKVEKVMNILKEDLLDEEISECETI